MERWFVCSSLLDARLHHFGARNAPRKRSGLGTDRAGWYLLDDDAVELDEPMGWEPLAKKLTALVLKIRLGL